MVNMKALEAVYDEKLYKLDPADLISAVENVRTYGYELMEIRPQRSHRIVRMISRLDEAIQQIYDGNKDEIYMGLLEDISDIHRTGKDMKRQMTQQYGERPNFHDLDEVILSGERIDLESVFNLMRSN